MNAAYAVSMDTSIEIVSESVVMGRKFLKEYYYILKDLHAVRERSWPNVKVRDKAVAGVIRRLFLCFNTFAEYNRGYIQNLSNRNKALENELSTKERMVSRVKSEGDKLNVQDLPIKDRVNNDIQDDDDMSMPEEEVYSQLVETQTKIDALNESLKSLDSQSKGVNKQLEAVIKQTEQINKVLGSTGLDGITSKIADMYEEYEKVNKEIVKRGESLRNEFQPTISDIRETTALLKSRSNALAKCESNIAGQKMWKRLLYYGSTVISLLTLVTVVIALIVLT